MRKVLVLGWGNPLRDDDSVGWRAAEALAGGIEGCQATVRVSHQLLPEFAQEISASDLVIFIDAREDNGASGKVASERVAPRCDPSATFSHELDPPALLGMAQALYGSCPEAYFFTVAGRRFGYGEELSPEVRLALPELLERIRALCGGTSSIDLDSRKTT